jgi:hypothetical protein
LNCTPTTHTDSIIFKIYRKRPREKSPWKRAKRSESLDLFPSGSNDFW